MRWWLAVYLKGFCMGAADMVPGVSGGTIALIAGIYDRLVAAIASLDPRELRHFLRPHDPDERAAAVESLRRMDVPFLIALGAGMVTAVVVVAEVITTLLEAYRAETAAFFVGLIAASAVLIGRQLPWSPRRIGLGLAGALVAAGVATATGPATEPALGLVLLAGAVAISAMVLPGVSGALLLIILGQYEYLLGELRAFLGALAALPGGGSGAALVDPGTVVAVFLSGAAVGLLTVAHAVNWALERYRVATFALLVGLMAGGTVAPAQIAVDAAEPEPLRIAAVAIALAFGAAVLVVFDRLTDDLEYVEA